MSDTPTLPNTEPAIFSVGQALRAGREAHSLTLEFIAEKLKLSTRQLAALESDDYDSLPGNTFVRGFVRNYARLIGIEVQPLLDHLSTILPQERVQVALPRVGDATALNAVLRAGAEGRPWLVWLMVALGLLLGVGAVFWYLQQPATPEVAIASEVATVEMSVPVLVNSGVAPERTSEPDSVPVILSPTSASMVASAVQTLPMASASATAKPLPIASASVPVAPAVKAGLPVTVKASATAASKAPALLASRPVAKLTVASVPVAAIAGSMVRVTAEFDSWVQIVDADNQVLVSQLMTQGAERSVSGKPPFRVKIGNAPKTRLYYRGKTVDLTPYAKADVATLELK